MVDSLNMAESKMKKPVVRVRTIQSKESVQISFLLKSKVDDFEIETDDDHISIFLRTEMAENANKIKEMRRRWLLDTIVIDAGHGGKDPGAVGHGGLQEKTVTLDIAKKLGKLIQANMGIKVIYTRDEDVFVPLWKRTKFANDSGGMIFISIHANSVPNSPSVRGFETFLLRPGKTKDAIEVASRENAVIALEELYHNYEKLSNDKLIIATMAQSNFMKESEFLAAEIQRELDRVLTSPNRGVKQSGFHVLVGATMPNVLIEAGFLSNKNESELLGQSRYRQKIAQAIFSALVNFKDKYENSLIGDN
jgi:N-acetylmuramoyl-L-alanine amidase